MIENGQGGNEEDHEDGWGKLLDNMDLADAMMEQTNQEPEAAEQIFHEAQGYDYSHAVNPTDDGDKSEVDDESDDD